MEIRIKKIKKATEEGKFSFAVSPSSATLACINDAALLKVELRTD